MQTSPGKITVAEIRMKKLQEENERLKKELKTAKGESEKSDKT